MTSSFRRGGVECGGIMLNERMWRINHQRCSIIKASPKKFAIFTGKHLCLPVNIANFLRTPILRNICKRPLLSVRWPDNLSENSHKSLFKGPGMRIHILKIFWKFKYFGNILSIYTKNKFPIFLKYKNLFF